MLARAQSLRSLALSRVSGLSRSISYHLKSRPIDPYTYTSDDESMPTTFEVKSERVVHQRYLTVFDRVVKFTGENAGQEKELTYDVVGHPKNDYHFAVVFPFHPAGHDGAEAHEPQVTLIREYAQGINGLAYCLPTGGFDPHKHTTVADCARAELSEEALLHGGELHRLLPEGHPGFAEVKWCANRFTPYLVLNPEADPQPGDRDPEEHIQVLRVGLPELRRLMVSGDMMLPSITTCMLALQKLEALKLV